MGCITYLIFTALGVFLAVASGTSHLFGKLILGLLLAAVLSRSVNDRRDSRKWDRRTAAGWCMACQGKGRVTEIGPDRPNRDGTLVPSYVRKQSCSNCGGTGRVPRSCER